AGKQLACVSFGHVPINVYVGAPSRDTQLVLDNGSTHQTCPLSVGCSNWRWLCCGSNRQQPKGCQASSPTSALLNTISDGTLSHQSSCQNRTEQLGIHYLLDSM